MQDKPKEEPLDDEFEEMHEDDERRYNIGICFATQTSLYDDDDSFKKIRKGFRASDDNTLRNRAFINTITTADS